MGVVNLADLACVLRTTTKKVVNFLSKKSAPRKKLFCYTPMSVSRIHADSFGGGRRSPSVLIYQ